jgi:hypothetical protein
MDGLYASVPLRRAMLWYTDLCGQKECSAVGRRIPSRSSDSLLRRCAVGAVRGSGHSSAGRRRCRSERYDFPAAAAPGTAPLRRRQRLCSSALEPSGRSKPRPQLRPLPLSSVARPNGPASAPEEKPEKPSAVRRVAAPSSPYKDAHRRAGDALRRKLTGGSASSGDIRGLGRRTVADGPSSAGTFETCRGPEAAASRRGTEVSGGIRRKAFGVLGGDSSWVCQAGSRKAGSRQTGASEGASGESSRAAFRRSRSSRPGAAGGYRSADRVFPNSPVDGRPASGNPVPRRRVGVPGRAEC